MSVQVKADTCELLQEAKDHRGRSEPAFHLFRVRPLPAAPAVRHKFAHVNVCAAQPEQISKRVCGKCTTTPNGMLQLPQHNAAAALQIRAHATAPVLLMLVCAMQNGACKKGHTIEGANTCLLSSLIGELVPNSPDADEPEVCHDSGIACECCKACMITLQYEAALAAVQLALTLFRSHKVAVSASVASKGR